MSAYNNNKKIKEENNRIYLFVNIIIFTIIGMFTYFQIKLSYTETNTGIKFRLKDKGKGISIAEYIEKTNKENVDKTDEKGKVISKKVDLQYLLSFERNITYKGKVLEYPNENPRMSFIYDYNSIVENNYCGDYIECLNMFKNVGDTYLFKIKKKDIKDNENVRKLNIPDDELICVELKLVNVLDTRNTYGIFMSQISKFYSTYNNKKEKEKDYIMRYINNIGRKFYVVGDYFVVLDDPGRGEYIKDGDKVKLDYTKLKHGYNVEETTNGSIAERYDIVDNKKEYKPIDVTYNSKDFSNFFYALSKFKKGSTGKIYYPSVSYEENKEINFYEVFVDIVSVTPAPPKIEKKKEQIKNNEVLKQTDKIITPTITNNDTKKTDVVKNNDNVNVSNNKPNNNVKKEKPKKKKIKKPVEGVDEIHLGKKKHSKKKNEKEVTNKEILDKAKEKRKIDKEKRDKAKAKH